VPKKESEFISIIYNKKNDSPKYFEIKKTKILLFFIGLPSITLIAVILGAVGVIHTSPFHLIDNYRQNSKAREAIAKTQALEEEKMALTAKLTELQEKFQPIVAPTSDENKQETIASPIPLSTTSNVKTNSIPTVQQVGNQVVLQGLSSLSLFRQIPGQHDRTKPPTLSLSGFQVSGTRDNTSLLFNIIPTGDSKIAGHIIVLMKNELTIQVYPSQALNSAETQINYETGESFSTQRFRPVDASFLKPRKPGNYTFSIFIFAKNGDLIHYQSVIMPVKF
jgi:hypothetical protein